MSILYRIYLCKRARQASSHGVPFAFETALYWQKVLFTTPLIGFTTTLMLVVFTTQSVLNCLKKLLSTPIIGFS